jgi:hypothetical protein
MELPNFKKIILLIAIVICFYVIYQLIQRRQTILATIAKEEEAKEPFQTVMPTIVNTTNTKLPLKEYFIFSSWNSCTKSDGSVSLDQLGKVLEHGCRFLDFEIYEVDDKPVVGWSRSGYQTNNSVQQMDNDNTISFIDVCNKIGSSKCPNPNDPLFLHFRIKTNNVKILEKMSENFIGSGLKEKFYSKKVTGKTLLSEIVNKTIVVVDKTYVPQIESNACKKGCKTDIRDMIQMFSGTNQFSSMMIQHQLTQDPRPVQMTTDDRTNVSKMKMITHGFGTQYETRNDEDFVKLAIEHAVQIVPHKFYYEDDSLTEYKNFFSDNGHHAFTTMGVTHSALIHK